MAQPTCPATSVQVIRYLNRLAIGRWKSVATLNGFRCRLPASMATPINKMSAGRPPSQTLKASRCAMAAASPIHRGSSVVGWLAKGTTAWLKPAANAALNRSTSEAGVFLSVTQARPASRHATAADPNWRMVIWPTPVCVR